MRRVVLTQPMYFPWVGMFEQLRLADIVIYYDDVQFSKGSFTNRVQLKTAHGPQWLTLPLKKIHLGQHIASIEIDESKDWRRQHRGLLHEYYRDTAHFAEMMDVAEMVFALASSSLCQMTVASMEAAADYFALYPGKEILYSSKMQIDGRGWERVLAIVQAVGGDVYITGHGARNYLDHEAFERSGIEVEYMAYQRAPYAQCHGIFDPHVSILDLIANVGRPGNEYIRSSTVPWREFLKS